MGLHPKYKFGSNDAQSGIELIATTSLKDPSLSSQNPSFQPVVSTLALKFMDGGEHIESLKLSPRWPLSGLHVPEADPQ
jgi:hypothetical protein